MGLLTRALNRTQLANMAVGALRDAPQRARRYMPRLAATASSRPEDAMMNALLGVSPAAALPPVLIALLQKREEDQWADQAQMQNDELMRDIESLRRGDYTPRNRVTPFDIMSMGDDYEFSSGGYDRHPVTGRLLNAPGSYRNLR